MLRGRSFPSTGDSRRLAAFSLEHIAYGISDIASLREYRDMRYATSDMLTTQEMK